MNVALGLVASEVAARRDDDRTFLVSMALLASAGFLGLHALATPGVLIDHTTAGFSVAARVGGDEREVSVLFADLAGFTGFSEERPASEVVEMLNRYWAAAVPAVVGEGGLIDRFAGDAIIVVFNAVTDQPDHAMRAARAALAIRSDTEHLAAEHASWPRFRIAVNTGPAVVGNIGAPRRGRHRAHDGRGPRRPRHSGPSGRHAAEGQARARPHLPADLGHQLKEE